MKKKLKEILIVIIISFAVSLPINFAIMTAMGQIFSLRHIIASLIGATITATIMTLLSD